MPSIQKDSVRYRPDLGEVAYETLQDSPTMGFVANRVMPVKAVAEQTSVFPVIPVEALHSIVEDGRGSRGTYNRDDFDLEMGLYSTQDRGLEGRLDDRERALYRNLLDYEMVVTRRKMQQVLRAHEDRVASMVMSTANFPNPQAATAAWDVPANAKPKKDVIAVVRALHALGIDPNALIISYDTFLNLCGCDDVKSAVYQLFPDAAKTGTISIEHLRTYFDLDVIVGGALKNTKKRGVDASLTGIWSDSYAMVARVSSNDDIADPCIGRTFVWNEGQGDGSLIVEDYPEDASRSDILRVRWDVQASFLASRAADGITVKSNISQRCGKLISGIKT